MKEHLVKGVDSCRLDRYLKRLFPQITQAVIEKALRKKDLRVNRKKVLSSERVCDGDVISYFDKLFMPFHQHSDSRQREYSSAVKSLATKILSEYLLEDAPEFIAINKPAGLAVQGGSKIALSVDDALSYLSSDGETEYKLVHRIDKATSGLLLIAKGHVAAAKLAVAFKDRHISKTYLATVEGQLKHNEGIIENYLSKTAIKGEGGYEIVQEVSKLDGKYALTEYKLLNYNKATNTSIVQYLPKTGRMHQLRAHSRTLNCPILGDVKYGAKKYKRLMLHAYRLEIDESVFGRAISLQADILW